MTPPLLQDSSTRAARTREVLAGCALAALLAAHTFLGFGSPEAVVAITVIVSALWTGPAVIAVALTTFVLPLVSLPGPVADARPDELAMVGLALGVLVRAALGRIRVYSGVERHVLVFLVLAAMGLGIRAALAMEAPELALAFPFVKHLARLALLVGAVDYMARDVGRMRVVRVALVLGGVTAAAIAIGQYFFPFVESWIVDTYPSIRGTVVRLWWFGRTFGPFDGNPNHLGMAMVLVSLVALNAADHAKKYLVRVVWVMAGLVALIGLVHSGSRGGLIVLTVVVLGYVVSKRWLFVYAYAATLLYTVLVPNAMGARLGSLVFVRETGIELGTSTAGKVTMFSPEIATSSTLLKSVDSSYLDTLYNFGPVALFAFLFLLWVLFRRLWVGAITDRRGFAGAAFAATGAMIVVGANGAFFTVGRVSEGFWVVVAMGIAAMLAEAPEHERPAVSIASSVHRSSDARVVWRQASALAAETDVRLHLLEDGGDERLAFAPGLGADIVRHGAPKGRRARVRRTWGLVQRALTDRPDVLIVHDPEMLPALWALTAGEPVAAVYDVHEDYGSFVAIKPWIPRFVRPLVGRLTAALERNLVARMALVVVADDYLVERFEGTAKQLLRVRNHPPLALFRQGPDVGARPRAVIYVGGITEERGASLMRRVLAEVRTRVPDAELVLIGRAPHGAAPVSEEGVVVMGEVPYERLSDELGKARVGLALLLDVPKYRRNIPSKVFDYMAAATPFVASDFPNIVEATEGSGGLFVDVSDVPAVVDAVARLLTDDELARRLGADGRRFVEEHGGSEAETEALVAQVVALAQRR